VVYALVAVTAARDAVEQLTAAMGMRAVAGVDASTDQTG
jgi:hypothetical protein